MRDILISFLGTGNYGLTKYNLGKGNFLETRYIQEAIYKKINSPDLEVYICLTEGARAGNWIGHTRDSKTGKYLKSYRGLGEILDKRKVNYRIVDIKDGKTEDEIWENFDRISSLIREGDRVYLDITHSFRSIPIMMMAVLNYGKFIKNAQVEKIFYGAYEGRTSDNISPIFDITIFDTITDWTIGVDEFIRSGNTGRLDRVIARTRGQIFKGGEGDRVLASSMGSLSGALGEFTRSLHIARSLNLSQEGPRVKEALDKINYGEDLKFKPFEKVMTRIVEVFSNFTDSHVKNIFEATRFAYEFGLIQQGFTLMEENITSFLIELYVGSENLPAYIKDLDLRQDIDKVLLMKSQTQRALYTGSHYDLKEIDSRIGGYLSPELADMFIGLKSIRNDLNHSGIKEAPISFKSSRDNLKKFIEGFQTHIIDAFYNNGLINGLEAYSPRVFKNTRASLGLIFSHSLTREQIREIEEDLRIENLVYLPKNLQELWSNVPVEVESLDPVVEIFKNWVLENFTRGDYILVQGDFGMTYKLVLFLKAGGFRPIYSKTRRQAREYVNEEGQVVLEHKFKHEGFRFY